MPVWRERWSSTSGRGADVALTSTRPSPLNRTVTSAGAIGAAARRRTTRSGARIDSSVCPQPLNSNRRRGREGPEGEVRLEGTGFFGVEPRGARPRGGGREGTGSDEEVRRSTPRLSG